MGNTYLKDIKTQRSNDDMALSSYKNTTKRNQKRKGSVDTQSLSKHTAEHFFNHLTHPKPTAIKDNINKRVIPLQTNSKN